MARGEDTGHHPGRRVDRERFSTPPYGDEFASYAVSHAGATPDSSSWDIEDAAEKFVYGHPSFAHLDDDEKERHVDRLRSWYPSTSPDY